MAGEEGTPRGGVDAFSAAGGERLNETVGARFRSRAQMEADAAKRRREQRGYEAERNRQAFEREQATKAARSRLEAGRAGATFGRVTGVGDAIGGGGGNQVVTVRQQPPWSGPPIGPVRLPAKLGGRPLPGAANAVFVLGFGLAAVASWQPLIKPFIYTLWNATPAAPKLPGKAPPMTWPGGAVVALPLFILLLVFIASLSPESAQVTLYFILALWAVFLVMNPDLVSGAMAFFTQRNPATGAIGPAGPAGPKQTSQQTSTGGGAQS